MCCVQNHCNLAVSSTLPTADSLTSPNNHQEPPHIVAMSLQPPSLASRPKGGAAKTTKAVILVGGPSRGTRFRPLSMELPKVSRSPAWHYPKERVPKPKCTAGRWTFNVSEGGSRDAGRLDTWAYLSAALVAIPTVATLRSCSFRTVWAVDMANPPIAPLPRCRPPNHRALLPRHCKRP